MINLQASLVLFLAAVVTGSLLDVESQGGGSKVVIGEPSAGFSGGKNAINVLTNVVSIDQSGI